MIAQRIVIIVFVGIYLVFWSWYGGTGEPLTDAERSAAFSVIEARAAERGGVDRELLESLRHLMSEDDGNEFYMINLMRFREKALYPPGSEYDDDVEAAANRYAQAVVPELFKRGSLPVLVANPTGTFLQPEDSDEWDQVGIVRYRSRRDMLDMVLALSESGQGIHKWASIEKTQVFPAEPYVDLVFVRGAMAVILALAGTALVMLLRLRGGSARGA